MKKISQILNESIESSSLKKQLDRCAIWRDWEKIVGDELSKKIRPCKWIGQTLVIKASSPAWMNEMTFLKDEVFEKIKKTNPDLNVEEIRFELR